MKESVDLYNKKFLEIKINKNYLCSRRVNNSIENNQCELIFRKENTISDSGDRITTDFAIRSRALGLQSKY